MTAIPTPEDLHRALDAVAAGDTEAFRHLVQAHALGLRSYLASHIYRLDAVDDLTQETFLAAYESLATFQRDGDFAAWLRGIARNKVLNYFRASQRRGDAMERFRQEVAVLTGAELDQEAAAERDETIEALLRCITRLPERLRTVVRAGLDGEKPGALAESLGTSVNAVYTLHWRANQLLRTCVQQELA